MTDKKFCQCCGRLISDKNSPTYNRFRHSRVKYCGMCRETMRTIQNRNSQLTWRQRNKQEKSLMTDKINLLYEENEILRQQINELRNKQIYGG